MLSFRTLGWQRREPPSPSTDVLRQVGGGLSLRDVVAPRLENFGAALQQVGPLDTPERPGCAGTCAKQTPATSAGTPDSAILILALDRKPRSVEATPARLSAL